MVTASLPVVLERLGPTADAIAATLTTAGIKAARGEPCGCALAEYLRTQGFWGVKISYHDGPGFIVTTASAEHIIGWRGPLAEFIWAFDTGWYPLLVANAAPERAW